MEITTGTETGAGAEGADGAAGAEGAAAAAETPDVTKIVGEFGSRLDGFMERIGGEIESLKAQPAAAEGGDETGTDEPSMPQYGVADFDEDGMLKDEAQGREMARIAGEIADQRVADIKADRAAERDEAAWKVRDDKSDALEEKYPDLADDEKQEHYVGIAKDLAEQLGKPDLAIEPDWLERVYLSEKAKEEAGDEIPAGGKDGVTLERGGVIATSPGSEGQDDGDRIVALAKQRRHRI